MRTAVASYFEVEVTIQTSRHLHSKGQGATGWTPTSRELNKHLQVRPSPALTTVACLTLLGQRVGVDGVADRLASV